MAKRTTDKLGPNIAETEMLHDSQGRAVDDDYIDAAVADAVQEARRSCSALPVAVR